MKPKYKIKKEQNTCSYIDIPDVWRICRRILWFFYIETEVYFFSETSAKRAIDKLLNKQKDGNNSK